MSSSTRRSQVAVAVSLLLGSGLAHAQSTGSSAVEGDIAEVTVTASRIVVLGTASEQTAAKTRVSVSPEYIATQPAGQTVFQSINQVPGVNFTNNDAYGNSGGNLRIRGFEGSRISATFDGMPINDSGNYALFTNQILDPELIERLDVNLGTTDVDSPTASATGGTVAFRSRTPGTTPGGTVVLSGGDESFRRALALLDTGSFGPWGTRAWVAASMSDYDKFKGPGDLGKRQYNAKLLQTLGDGGDFVSVAFHYTRVRADFYRTASAASFRQFGFDYDNLATCTRDLATPGVADNDGATPVATTPALPSGDNLANPSSCANFYGVRINPVNTGNVRAQSLFHLGDSLILTIDPSFQYTLANGGGSTVLGETPAAGNADRRVVGTTALTGFDLNGDGDLLDQVRFYSPNITNTRRFGLTTSLIWELNDTNRLRAAYTADYARHRQTSPWTYLDDQGFPLDPFAGRLGPKVPTADGSFLRGRDRFSIASLNQFSLEHRGELVDGRLVTQIGLRAPFFERELNQHCYTPNGGSGNSGGVLCTTQAPLATRPNGNVVFTPGAGAVEHIPPYQEDIKFDDLLPNVGATWRLADSQSLYASFAQTLSAPRTDNLYPVRRQPDNSIGRGIPESETANAYDIGWRFNSPGVLASAAVYYVDYDNRIVSSFDPDLGFSVDRNLGKVKIRGLDLQGGWRAAAWLTLSGSASYNHSEVQENVPLSGTTFLATAGKRLVETPDWTYALRADVTPLPQLHLGVQGKYVGERAGTDTNDEFAPSFIVWDLDASWDLGAVGFAKELALKLNVVNLFDKDYFGSISSGTGGSSVAFYNVGPPRAASLSVKVGF